MFTRSPLNMLRCYSCDKELDAHEIQLYFDYDGLCEDCYTQSMGAAYDDPLNFDENTNTNL